MSGADASGSQEPWLSGIEGDAGKTLITTKKRFVQVVAGPGSGKTTGLKRRVKRLIEGDGVKPDQIFVGTFTRAIAAELAAALAPAVGTGKEPRPKVGTLHAQATEMLRMKPAAAPGRAFRFLLEHEQSAMLYDIAGSVPELPNNDARQRELRKVQSFWSGATDLTDERFRGATDAWLRRHGGMLIGEVVYLALNALNLGDLDGGVFDHVIVDEYQDLTAAEQQLVEKLLAPIGGLVVLGDDDQSIYRFRFNHPDGITGFSNGREAEALEQIKIPENRRSGDVIVELANRMMAAAGSKKPPMIAKLGEKGQVDILHWADVDAEIEGLATYMQARLKANADEKFLVLVPRQFIGHRLRDRIGEDASTSFHEEVLQEHLVRERFALASLFVDPTDEVAVRAWLAFEVATAKPALNRNAVAVASLAGSGSAGVTLLEAIASGRVVPKGEGQGAVKARARLYVAEKAALPAQLEDILSKVFDPAIAERVEDTEGRATVRSDLQLLRDAGLELAQRDGATLASVLSQLRYRIATRMPLLDDQQETRVRIMTLHGAKGLEADVIIVAGLADQVLPGREEKDAAETAARFEEQRRLLYVAVTRAKKHLILSRPRSVKYRIAARENIRIDKTKIRRVKGSETDVQLSASRFIPAGTPATDGPTWLKKLGS